MPQLNRNTFLVRSREDFPLFCVLALLELKKGPFVLEYMRPGHVTYDMLASCGCHQKKTQKILLSLFSGLALLPS